VTTVGHGRCPVFQRWLTTQNDNLFRNQIKIRLIRWQIITTDTDAKVVYINTMPLEGRLMPG